jgi:hypothetical protein
LAKTRRQSAANCIPETHRAQHDKGSRKTVERWPWPQAGLLWTNDECKHLRKAKLAAVSAPHALVVLLGGILAFLEGNTVAISCGGDFGSYAEKSYVWRTSFMIPTFPAPYPWISIFRGDWRVSAIFQPLG